MSPPHCFTNVNFAYCGTAIDFNSMQLTWIKKLSVCAAMKLTFQPLDVFVWQQTHKCRMVCCQASHVRNLHPDVTPYDHILSSSLFKDCNMYSPSEAWCLLELTTNLPFGWCSASTNGVHFPVYAGSRLFLSRSFTHVTNINCMNIWIIVPTTSSVLSGWRNAPDDPVQIW